MTPSPATDVLYQYLSENISKIGFRWEHMWLKEVDTEQLKISFELEWNQFILCVSKITGIKPPEESTAAEYKSPWEKYFQHVINPARCGNGKDCRMYENEHTFSDVLFEALRSSLQEFVDPNVFGRNFIVLKNSHIGFGKGIARTKLGFKGVYLVSSDGRSHHGCFVFGSRTKKRQTTDARDDDIETFHYHDDMTASVVPKLDTKMCLMFNECRELCYEEKETHEWLLLRGIVGQAMIFTCDVLRCLARRGVSVESIPVVVLAGKAERTDSNHICCLDARMIVPETYGNDYSCLFNRIISFNGTVAVPCDYGDRRIDLATDASQAVISTASPTFSDVRDKLAIAIYIKTMRVGLEHAYVISKNRSEQDALSAPVSVCCRNLLSTNVSAPLVASSIPNANRFSDSGLGLKIHQGELFSLDSPTKDDFSRDIRIHWFDDSKSNDILTRKCLVKVSCGSVHDTYVRRECLYFTLSELVRSCDSEKNTALKHELAKVLLGYSNSKELFLTMVMKDLRDEGFVILDHQRLRHDGKLPELWTGFCALVKSLLLPMANRFVVHSDIRSTTQYTYNILCHVCSTNEIELRLIDYDSLTNFKWVSDRDLPIQEDAVNWRDLSHSKMNKEERDVPALIYLFWQVLWLAYTWHPQSAPVSPDSLPKHPSPRNFVNFLSRDKYYENFKDWLGEGTVGILKSINNEEITEASIITVLESLRKVFCGKEHGKCCKDGVATGSSSRYTNNDTSPHQPMPLW